LDKKTENINLNQNFAKKGAWQSIGNWFGHAGSGIAGYVIGHIIGLFLGLILVCVTPCILFSNEEKIVYQEWLLYKAENETKMLPSIDEDPTENLRNELV